MFGFKKNKQLNYQPIPKGFYAWTVEHAGDFLLFVESMENCYKFVYLPGADYYYLTLEDFTKAIKTGVLDFVEELPDDVYKETLEFAKYGEDKNNVVVSSHKRR